MAHDSHCQWFTPFLHGPIPFPKLSIHCPSLCSSPELRRQPETWPTLPIVDIGPEMPVLLPPLPRSSAAAFLELPPWPLLLSPFSLLPAISSATRFSHGSFTPPPFLCSPCPLWPANSAPLITSLRHPLSSPSLRHSVSDHQTPIQITTIHHGRRLQAPSSTTGLLLPPPTSAPCSFLLSSQRDSRSPLLSSAARCIAAHLSSAAQSSRGHLRCLFRLRHPDEPPRRPWPRRSAAVPSATIAVFVGSSALHAVMSIRDARGRVRWPPFLPPPSTAGSSSSPHHHLLSTIGRPSHPSPYDQRVATHRPTTWRIPRRLDF